MKGCAASGDGFWYRTQYLDLWPDPSSVSCMAAFNHSNTADYVSRSGEWHHIAVTWTARGSGRTRIYQDGLLMAEVGLQYI